MSTVKSKYDFLIVISIAFYIVGIFFIHNSNSEWLKDIGVAKQETYVSIDSEGEEYEHESLIEINGIGPILTYKDVYLVTIPFLIASMIFGKMIFPSIDHPNNELRFIIFTNCIIGLLLIWLTTKPNIVSTILYWCGILTANFVNKHD